MDRFDWITATPRLEPVDYIRKPQVISRLLSLIFAVVVFGVVHNKCYIYGICLFNEDNGTCGFASFLGISTLILCIIYLLFDSCVDNISNCETRLNLVLSDLCLTGFWTVLWFISFCLMCNRWRFTADEYLVKNEVSSKGPRAAIAFSFFSWITLTVLTYLCSLSYRTTKLLVTNMNQISSANMPNQPNPFRTYPVPGLSPYHGLVSDVDLLDASSRPAQLGSDSPSFGRTGQGRPTDDVTRPGGGGTFAANLVEAYKP